MSKHKALELADKCQASAELWESEVATRIQAAAELRAMHDREQRQHALIVQMREALKTAIAAHELGVLLSGTGTRDLRTIIAAADQYLGEQA